MTRGRRAAVVVAAVAVAACAPGTSWARADAPPTASAHGTAARTAPPSAPAAADPVAAAETAAGAKAKASGAPVTVDALTSQTSQTVANPDGSLTLTQHAIPVRVRRGSGWTAVDTTLARRADGLVAPKATALDVAFSGGGAAPLAVLTSGSGRLAISWPDRLPAPTLAGDTATYANVLPGVDLAMTATADGIGEVLVVKTAAAAADPRLAALRFGVAATGLTVKQNPDGTQSATDASGQVVFQADTPLMWDSTDVSAPAAQHSVPTTPHATGHSQTTAPPAQPRTAAIPAPAGTDRSDVHHPGAAAHVAQLGTSLAGGVLTLTPDRSLLTAADASFPLYIDPAWSGSHPAWASISSNGMKNTTGTEARVGYDDWAGCGSYCGSINRTYFNMDATGFQGATKVTQGLFYPYFSWAADSSPEPTQVWVDPAFTSSLDWANKPSGSSSVLVRTVSSCAGHGTSGCSAGTVKFDVTSVAQSAANGGNHDLEVDAQDEGNDMEMKHLDPTQTYWSVTYFRAPYVKTFTTTPTVTGPGGTFVNSKTVTMLATGGDTDGENVRSGYEIWNWANGAATTSVVTGLFSAYSASGGSQSYGSLADGTYAWRASTESEEGALWSPWGAWQVFTVDATPPATPQVESPQFPANQFGATYGDVGKFTFTNFGLGRVSGYIFSLDGDLGTTVWSQTSQPPTFSSGTITRGSQYWAPLSNGNASVSFAPLTVGVHRLYAKAVSESGLTSGEAVYTFYAGLTEPIYAYGDQLVNGCATANTCNGNTVPVPAGQATVTAGAALTTQSDCCDIRFADGKQAMLQNGTGKVAVGDSAVFTFNLPTAGAWDIGANLTGSYDYGQYSLTFDKGTATEDVLTPSHDAYSASVSTSYQYFGPIKNSAGTLLQLPAGLHTLTLTVTGKNASSTGYQAGLDVLRLSPMSATCTITDLSGCADNVAVSDDSNHLEADADGVGSSLSAGELQAAGWAPGAAITVDGAPMTLPKYGSGKADNVLSSAQVVNVPSTYANNGDAVEFLAFGTMGQVTGATGTITYTSPCNSSPSQPFTIDSVPDWADSTATDKQVVSFASRNTDSGTQATAAQLYVVSVPMVCPGHPIASVTLPLVANKATSGTTALHILAMGIRASSYTDTSDTQNWTGTYGAAVDSHLGTLGAQTVRMPVHISVAGTSVRLRLSNALGTVPVSFDHVTIAAQGSGAVPAGTPTDVLFSGGKTLKIPAGGDAVSDPLPFATTGQENLLVSVHLSAADDDVVGHGVAKATGWTAAAGTDQSADTTGTPFTTAITSVDFLSGIDVTSSGNTLGSLVLFGDQSVNSDSASGDNSHRLSDLLAAKLAAGNGGTVPYGVLNEGTNSGAPSATLLPALSTSATSTVPPSALNPADSRILESGNVRTALISTGMADILAGGDATSIENKLAALSEQVRHFSTDDASDYNVNINNNAGLITVYLATIPPPATALTGAQEAVREAVNSWILTVDGGSYAAGHADGAIDFAAAVSATGTDAGTTLKTSDLYNGAPNDAYYDALAQQYLTNTATPPSPTNTVTVQPMVIR